MIWSGIILMATTILLYVLFWHGVLKTSDIDKTLNVKRAMLFYAAWIAFVCACGQTQVFADFNGFPPRFLFFWILILGSAIAFSFSATGRSLAMHTPLWFLVGFQGFRILAEWALYEGYQEGVFPIQMTFEGKNFDIVSGVFALGAGVFLKSHPNNRVIPWTFNVVGMVLLLTIIVIATLSTPTPLRVFMNEPANTIVTAMPHILLPGVLVHAAFYGHFLLTRRLLGSPS